jgi:tetrahydromethanopterin S-methyltransferase subunit B
VEIPIKCNKTIILCYNRKEKIMPDMRIKVEEYIKELKTEVDRLTREIEANVNRMNITQASCIKTRIDSYTNVINDLKNRLREVE